jgi:hypothetical protein
MTDVVNTVDLRAVIDVGHQRSLRRRVWTSATAWVVKHRTDIATVLPLLAIVAVAHATDMSNYPGYVDDPGTYLSQAWAVQYEHRLSPYSYFYDHAPAGWIQMAFWSTLTDGFDRYHSAIAFGNECMLIAKVVSAALLYGLSRRLGLGRVAASVATLMFGLCPLELVYGRWTYLDNLVTPWLLLAFLLAYSPRRSIWAATAAALSFGMATLTKETALVLLPAFAWALLQNQDRRNRAQVLVTAAFGGLFLMAMYPLYALYKGELFAGPGHNSLLGTASWQLSGRQSGGSVLNPHSGTFHEFSDWLQYDRWLLLLGLAAIPVGLAVRRLRPITIALAIQWLMLVRGGYVPYMHVINLMPWSALVLAAVGSVIAGRPQLVAGGWARLRGSPAERGARIAAATLMLVGFAGVAATSWTPKLHMMMTSTQQPPLRQATRWIANNVPRNKVLVVHDAIWTDLVQYYGFTHPKPIIVYKLDTDPAVRASTKRVDYLVVPDWYYQTPDAEQKYPTLMEARKHAVPVAAFGSGSDRVQIYRVSKGWELPS